MAFTVHSFRCDYLTSHGPSIPYDFASEQVELAHLNEQTSSLDSHISQLNTLRRALQCRSNQLHNMLSPIYTLPIELLSRIFQQLIISSSDRSHLFSWYHACLSQAFTLISVSAHFRHVALGTPELWKRISFNITNREAVGKTSSLLRHCMALTTSINVSVFDQLDEEEARSAIDALLTSDMMPKIKVFELEHSAQATCVWIKKLKGSSLPMLNALSMKNTPTLNFDFGSLKTVTRLGLHGTSIHGTIIAPPSLQYLATSDISIQALVSLLYQCPNLVELHAVNYPYFFEDGIQFNEPLTLSHLKRITFRGISVATTPLSLQNLRLPSLETLQLEHQEDNQFIGFILLCRNVSRLSRVSKYMWLPMPR